MAIKNIDLNNLKPEQGFKIVGSQAYDLAGTSVSGGFDINKDGIADIIIGAPGASFIERNSSGLAYVIYGKKEGYGSVDLQTFNFTDAGFRLLGASPQDKIGQTVCNSFDFNDDKVDDILIGAPNASPFGRLQGGVSYIIYGVQGGYQNDIDLKHISDGNTNGFIMLGASQFDASSYAIGGGFNINDDRIMDIIVSAPNSSSTNASAGTSYVVYGRKEGYTDIDFSSFDSTAGFQLLGDSSDDFSGISVSGLRDVNADGIDDVVVASLASPVNRTKAGIMYVIYGNGGGYKNIELGNLSNYTTCNTPKPTTCYGFRILGENDFISSSSVGGSFDINADGINDLLIGLLSLSNRTGEIYVVYGKKGMRTSDVDLKVLAQDQGFKIFGSGSSVSKAGDINHDGIDDIIIGSRNSAYVVFGKKGGYAYIDLTSDLTQSDSGFKISGFNSSISVSGAGDFNNDGVDDLIIGLADNSPLGREQAGEAYIVYGSRQETPPSPDYIKEYVIPIAVSVGGALVVGAAVFLGRKKYLKHKRGEIIVSPREEKQHLLHQLKVQAFSGVEESISFKITSQEKLELGLDGTFQILTTYSNQDTKEFISSVYASLINDERVRQILALASEELEVIFDQPASGYFNNTIAIKTDLSSILNTKAILMHELTHVAFEAAIRELGVDAIRSLEAVYEESFKLLLNSETSKESAYLAQRRADYIAGLENGKYSAGVDGYGEMLARCVEMKVLGFTDVSFCGPIESVFDTNIITALNDNCFD